MSLISLSPLCLPYTETEKPLTAIASLTYHKHRRKPSLTALSLAEILRRHQEKKKDEIKLFTEIGFSLSRLEELLTSFFPYRLARGFVRGLISEQTRIGFS